jgi:hydroxymethylbilane synthase
MNRGYVSETINMTATKPIYIATRGSALALAQANQILAQCRSLFPAETFDLKIIKTTGDKLQTASLASAELPKGLFTKEIEEALLSGEADLAVHSLKDLPTELPAGLKLGAVTRRADVRDVIVYRHSDFQSSLLLAGLPNGAVVATSSTRRAAQVLERRPDLKVVPIRGNVGTFEEARRTDGTQRHTAGRCRADAAWIPDRFCGPTFW